MINSGVLINIYHELQPKYDRSTVYNQVDNVTGLTPTTRVYFLSEGEDMRYEVKFGDDSIGAKRKLTARCGDTSNPCFNIEISKGSIKTQQEFVDYWKNEAQKDKLNIVRIKLDVLFNYLTNEDIDKEFNELREKVKEANEEYIEREMVLSNIVNNPDKEREITDLNNKLDNILLKQKIKLERFKKGQNSKLVKELIQEYSKDLIPLLDNLRNMKYEYTNVNYNKQTDNYVLSQKEILTDSLETFVGDDKPKVINYIFN